MKQNRETSRSTAWELTIMASSSAEVLPPSSDDMSPMPAFSRDPLPLADAGDITPYGERKNVLLIREENGERVYHRLHAETLYL